MSYLTSIPKDVICHIILKLPLRPFINIIKAYPILEYIDWRYMILSRGGISSINYFMNNYKYVSREMYQIMLICEPLGGIDKWESQHKKVLSSDKYHENIWYLSNLVSLSLVQCKDLIIPDHVSYMKSLRDLRIQFIDVLHMNSELSKLNITSITINFCELTQIPDEILQIRSLEKICLDNNKIEVISESTRLPVNLTSLSISDNKLKKLPQNISKWCGLRYLNVSYNFLTELPQKLVKLINLKSINIDDNKFEIFPEQLISHPSLTEISISGNIFTYIYINSEILTHLRIDRHVVVNGKHSDSLIIIRVKERRSS